MKLVNEILKNVKVGINTELGSIRKLKGKKLDTFKDVFGLSEDINLYYNEYNLVIIDRDLHDNLSTFFKRGSLLLKIEIPEHNSNLWVYQYFNDQIFENYLTDSVKYD